MALRGGGGPFATSTAGTLLYQKKYDQKGEGTPTHHPQTFFLSFLLLFSWQT